MGLLSAALVMAASTQATAQEYTFTTLAGPPELGPGGADGPGSLARFRAPSGATVDIAPASLSVIAPVQRSPVAAIYLAAEIGNYLHLEYLDAFGPGNAWRPLSDLAVTSAPQLCLDLSGPLAAQRFYRAWQANAAAAPSRLDLSLATAIPLTGALGSSVRIDCINAIGPVDAWVTQATVTLTTSPQLYFDLTAFRQAPRLYRLVPLPQTGPGCATAPRRTPTKPWHD
jgi:hypothetical protein